MTDLISLFLSAFSILQNVEKQGGLNEKKDAAIEALSKLDELYVILISAKNTHDQFQVMQTFLDGLKSIKSPAMFGRLGDTKKHELAEKIVGMDQSVSRRVSYKDLPLPPQHEDITTPLSADNRVVANSLSTALRIYVEFYDSLLTYDKILYSDSCSIEAMIRKEDFGKAFRSRYLDLRDSINRGSIAADQIIIELTPVVYELHLEVKRAVGKF